MLWGAFVVDGRPSLAAFSLVLENETLVRSIRDSFLLAGVVTLLATLLAAPLAALFSTYAFRGKTVVQAFLLSAMVVPPFVAAVGLRQVFARFGSINLALLELGWIDEPIDFLGRWPLLGVAVMETLHLYPILFLNLLAAFANVDPAMREAAESLGSSRTRRLVRVTLPLVLPGWFAGAVIVFLFALTDLGTPIVFDARNLVAVQIFERATESSRDPVGYALVVILLVLSLGLFLLGRRAVGARSTQQAGKGATAGALRPLSWPAQAAVHVALALLIAVTLLPHLSILLVSVSERWFFSVLPERFTLDHYANLLQNEYAYLGVRNSLVYASLSTAIDVVLGVAIAWLAVRRNSAAGRLFDALAMLPLALPGIVLAFGYAAAFAGTPLDPLSGPLLVLVFGYAMRRLPYVVRAADAGLRQVPRALEEAGESLGASGTRVLARVTLPLLLGNLLAGALLAFSFAMLEVSESLILAPSKESFPIAKAIYQLLGDIVAGPQIASAMGVIGSLLLLYALWVAGKALGKSLGELFRA